MVSRVRRAVFGQKRFYWAALNSDGLLLGLLATISGSATLLDPWHDEIGMVTGPTVMLFMRSTGLLVAGLLILYSLVNAHVAVEIIGRLVLVAAVLYQAFRAASVLGLETYTIVQFVLVGILGLTTFLRVSALTSREGLVLAIPPLPLMKEPDDV